ncbi:S-adenosyl-L-methionine-dependent methyltransferase [Stachybotrys elegans]|uniref:S-adenosyl-L-methionine-dependent methyltransferase n=1 Tax=Stachybotrys elegans TaxID=80388 RepID=A0A8K0SY94_9HYPO|nr:S-adenosyl-L-methionine-dependent methyltransferase [Stachybotrys elegans]
MSDESVISYQSMDIDIQSIVAPLYTDTDQETDEFELVDEADAGSLSEEISISSTSILPSADQYELIHGRRYHGYQCGRYPLPNDILEQQREETLHAMMLQVTGNRLFYSDIGEHPQKIVDIGTGTGSWAIDVADLYPSASVIGTDLSPIQPTWLPVNARMFVEDCEELDWLHGNDIDLVHFRSVAGVLRNLHGILREAHSHLRSGGWVEFQEFAPRILCDDGTMTDDDALAVFNDLAVEGMRRLGCTAFEPGMLEDAMKRTGFVNIQQVTTKIPISAWPQDTDMRIIGVLMREYVRESLDAYAAKPFEAMGISREEGKAMIGRAEEALECEGVHRYMNFSFMFGRKE